MLITAILFLDQPNASAQDSDVLMHDQVEIMPEYPGGIPAIRKHIAENIIYPESARNAKVSAKIFTSFVVDEQGKVTNVKIERTDIVGKNTDNSNLEIVVVGYEPDKNAEYNPDAISALENEAIRVIQSLGDFKPGMNGEDHVKVQYTFPIQFMLE
jgi:protein TonB